VQLALNLNIIMIKLLAHSTHILQPLDVEFFAPIKKLWFSAVEEYTRINKKQARFIILLADKTTIYL
jgi:hypothetical protein